MIHVVHVTKIYQPSHRDAGVASRGQIIEKRPELQDISATGPDIRALDDVTMTIRDGCIVCLTGPSGCGKSTLLNILGGIDRPTAGQVLVDGRDIAGWDDSAMTAYRRRTIGFVFQFFNLLPTMRVWENISLPMRLARYGSEDAIAQRTAVLAETVGLPHRVRHFPHELSGGEMQRVAIARALANDPRYILADEPTGNLDRANGDQVMDLLMRLAGEFGKTIVMATHSAALAERADEVYPIQDGSLTVRAT